MIKTIFGLAFKGTVRRRRQSGLMILILTISIAFAVIMMSYSSSILKTNSENRLDTYGEWYGAIAISLDSDMEYLESTEWIDNIGETVSYADISVGNSRPGYYIGTVDEEFVEMGRITTLTGRLPESAGEIAVESDVLNSLGYTSELGQDITININFEFSGGTDGVHTLTVVETYKLVGVVKEYTDIWDTSINKIWGTGGLSSNVLNSLIITEDSVTQLLADAEEIGETLYGSITFDEPYTGLYFTVQSGAEETAKTQLSRYLASSRASAGSNYGSKIVSINSLSTEDNGEASFNTTYIILILAVTLLATIIVYVLQMPAEIRRIVIMRSIGGTKSQLRILNLVETIMLSVPAIVLGIAFGALGTWLLLRLSVFAGSVSIIVSIPWRMFLISVALWLIGILAVRMVTFQIALATPLTGKMGMKISGNKRSRRFQKGLIVLISTALCTCIVFSVLNVLVPFANYSIYANKYSFDVNSQSLDDTVSTTYHISEEDIETLSTATGVTEVRGYTRNIPVEITVCGVQYETYLNAIGDTSLWDEEIDFTNTDLEAFKSGEGVVLSVPIGYGDYEVPDIGDEITITITLGASPGGVVDVDENGLYYLDIVTTVAGINYFDPDTPSNVKSNNLNITKWNPYEIVASLEFVQEIMDQMPEGSWWSLQVGAIGQGYEAGEVAGFQSALIYAEKDADLLVTGSELSALSTDMKVYLNSYGESNNARAQNYMQTVIMLIVSGVCIAVVVLIILSSTIRLETQREKKRYGILQAIGMSRRQRDFELARTAIVRSMVAVVLGWGVFILTVIVRNLDEVRKEGATALNLVTSYMSNLISYYMPAWVMALMTVALFTVVFIICYISKLGLNKYNLMEMLLEDR